MPAWIPYTALRLGLFAGTFLLLWLLQVPWLIAAIAAAVVGLTVSYIFFSPLRSRMAEEIAESRASGSRAAGPASTELGVDEDAEDAAAEATSPETSEGERGAES